jgi:hypothetical protein
MEFPSHRTIDGDMILSPGMPRAAIRYSQDFIYLGDLQYIARDTHHVEEFIFLRPSSIGHASRLLLVHFEGFLENKEGSYEFPNPHTMHLYGQDFSYERYFINIQDDLSRFPGSDLAHAADYIRQRSYTLAGDMIYQRFQRYVSPDRRNLFSISYMEANNEPRLTEASLAQDESAAQAMLERARSSFSIELH